MAGTDNRWLTALRTDRVWQVMAANLAVFVLVHLFEWTGHGGWIAWLVLPARPLDWIVCPWTAVTYMFTQWDFFHLVFNMLWLWTFGLMLTRTGLRSARVAMVYLAGGLGGALLWLILGATGAAYGVLVGSSAAVFAVIAFAGAILGRMPVQMMFLGNVQVRWLALAVIALCLLSDWSVGGWQMALTHLAGACAGVLYAMALRRGLFNRTRSKKTSWSTRSNRSNRPDPGYSQVRQQARRGLDATEQARLDAILLKVKKGGYAALTADEKALLFNLSSKIK